MIDRPSLLRGAAVAAMLLAGASAPAFAAPVQTIVLVHGAWVDGSGWKPVYDILTRDGYHVTVVQEPLTSLADDVAATTRILDLQDGPCILVAHSYGGSVITEAGVHPNVAGLVYVAAHAPDVGESEGALGKGMPSVTQQQAGAIERTADGFTFLDPARFHQDFAADLPREQAEFEARSQILTAAEVFATPMTAAAWRTKPSWAIVAGADRIINPDLQRWYDARAHSQTTELEPLRLRIAARGGRGRHRGRCPARVTLTVDAGPSDPGGARRPFRTPRRCDGRRRLAV